MRKKKKKASPSNLGLAFLFFLLVVFLLVLSAILRFADLLNKSKFDGSSQFTLKISQDKDSQLVIFTPKNSTIGILTIAGGARENVDRILEIPIDAKVSGENEAINAKILNKELFKLLFDFRTRKEINSVDILRFILFSETVGDNNIKQEKISDISDKRESNIVSTFFIDSGISEEKQSIEIVNSSDQFGLGNKLATYISNAGGNVILVTTGDSQDKSEILYFKKSYTVKKLSSVLRIKATKVERKDISDVKIVIGKDVLKDLKF